ncbi:MAG: hypothetical protein QOE70_3955 [Chthoniobacter sp.]|jgi:hypothetical protein|nr:hypothetical protein [Chthoniobacter sp.]
MSTAAPQFEWIRKGGLLAAAVVALAVWFFFFRPPKSPDSLNVPLGVEQAAIVTYSGPPVAVTPYKWGVAVNVRIARVIEQPGKRIYDVRYIVNRAGTFDLKDYLTADDGSSLNGLPSFKFNGDPKLSKNLDTRIQETEEVRVDVGGHYYATLAGLAAFWIVWLLLLIFYGRAKPPRPAAAAPPEPTLAEMLRAFLAQLEAGTLDAAAKAKMEMVLLRRWREELALENVPMSAALDAISRSEKTGNPLRQLQDWLHRPASKVGREEIAAVITPYTLREDPRISHQ